MLLYGVTVPLTIGVYVRLKRQGIRTIEQLTKNREWTRLPGIGEVTIALVNAALEGMGKAEYSATDLTCTVLYGQPCEQCCERVIQDRTKAL